MIDFVIGILFVLLMVPATLVSIYISLEAWQSIREAWKAWQK